jgi:hypothetical protein
MISSNVDGIFALANGPMSLSTCFFVALSGRHWGEHDLCQVHRPLWRPLAADLDHADQVMQKGETGYAVHKGHNFGTGIEAVLVQVPCL